MSRYFPSIMPSAKLSARGMRSPRAWKRRWQGKRWRWFVYVQEHGSTYVAESGATWTRGGAAIEVLTTYQQLRLNEHQ